MNARALFLTGYMIIGLALLALTLTPALCATLLKPHAPSTGAPAGSRAGRLLGRFFGGFNRGFERTTLTRNLDRLQKMALIQSRPAEHGNGRICSLTEKGEALVEQLLPYWRKAQAEIRL